MYRKLHRFRSLSKKWRKFARDLPEPRIEPLGKAVIRKPERREDPGFVDTGREGPAPIKAPREPYPCPQTARYRYVDYQERRQYRVTLDGSVSLSALRRRFPRQRGARVSPASRQELSLVFNDGVGPTLPSVIGEDTRVRIQPTDVFPYSAIVHLSEVICSGAMIGDDIVLTAAHCVANGGQCQDPGYEEVYYDFTVIPGMDRDPECAPGDESLDCRTMPFGEVGVEAALVPDGWFDPLGSDICGGFHPYDPYWWVHDIAVVFLSEPVGQETGFFDYDAKSAAQLENAAFLNRGYPTPVGIEQPPGYEAWQMWGDENYCLVESFAGSVNGIHQLFRHGCDTSGGHSGSPIYQWWLSIDEPPRPEIVGVVSHHAVGNNYAKRITDTDPLPAFAQILGLAAG